MKSLSKRQRRKACLEYILNARGISRAETAPVAPAPVVQAPVEPSQPIEPIICSGNQSQ